jgi:hypothetical protein
METVFSLRNESCACADIIMAFGSTECSECGLDYMFVPSIAEFAEGDSGNIMDIYRDYVSNMPTLCSCCAEAYADYIATYIDEAVDWASDAYELYYRELNEPEEIDSSEWAPWGGIR